MPQLHHVLNRGVDKRKIFMDDKDHYRFIYDLFEFNDQRRVRDSGYYFNIRAVGVHEYSIKNRDATKFVVGQPDF